jgi:hypothetical protein
MAKGAKAVKELKAEGTGRKQSSYIKWSTQRRPAVKAAHPGASFGELGKLLGAEWKGLSEVEKAKWA